MSTDVAKKSIKSAATPTPKTAESKIFYFFSLQLVTIFYPSKNTRFSTKTRRFALLRGEFYLRNAMKNQNTIFTFLLCILCALVSWWLNFNQSKITKNAKRTQFPKKSNVYNRNFNNELHRKTNNGHLVKTNPNKPNFSGSHFAIRCKLEFLRLFLSVEVVFV